MRSQIAVVALSVGVVLGGCATEQKEDADTSEDAVSAAAGRFEPGKEREGGFRPLNAAWLARASNVVYENRDRHQRLQAELERAIRTLGGPDLTLDAYRFFDAEGDTQGAYVATNRVAILALRGTENKFDIRRDLQIAKVKDGEARIHRGFYSAYSSLWDGTALRGEDRQGLGDYLKQRQALRPDVPLYITGHSLGAALATLITNAALKAGIPVFALYTFGSPRVGDGSFAEELARRAKERGTSIFRVINYGDPVTVVPPTWLGYKHVSLSSEDEDQNDRVVFLSKEWGKQYLGHTADEHTFQQRVRAYWASFKAGAPTHHPIPFYICKIDRVMNPNAPCLDLQEHLANQGCIAMGDAIARVMSKNQAQLGCGDSYAAVREHIQQSMRCQDVVGIRDKKSFEEKCLPRLSQLTCADINSDQAYGPDCADQLVYRE